MQKLMVGTSQEYAWIDYAHLWLPYPGPFARKMHFSIPKGCVTCMNEIFRKMAGNMNGLGPGRKLGGKRVLTGQSPCCILVYI